MKNHSLSIVYICLLFLIIGCTSSKKETEKFVEEEYTTNDQNPKWVSSLINAYRTLNENQSIEAANQLYEAAELMPKKNWEIYFMAATIYAPKNKNNEAFQSLDKAIQAGLRDSVLTATYPGLSNLRNDLRWNTLLHTISNNRKTYVQAIKNPGLLKELEEMWAQDQLALSQYEENTKALDSNASAEEYQLLFKPVEDRWEINRNKLDSIIDIHGWPGNKLVGEDGAKISWAIPQHYPDVFFKQKCLSLIEKAMKKGDMDPNHYAELNDRIARDTWQKQIYGASMAQDAPHPIKDPANVDKRRTALGLLEPIEVYAYYHGINYQRPGEEEAKIALATTHQKAQQNFESFEKLINQKNIDSANTHIANAISFYGELSNEQLYQASLYLAPFENNRSKRIFKKILKVLIWRKWEGRFQIAKQSEFVSWHEKKEWLEITKLLQKSQ
ncbi:DUF6624 domain-containing protein [Aquimarina sp. Aq78]|uniref:DUF6624 domain-containing protein n=1 Tax=Aquimarina sp. Aq78 TaxID=1191889 RepID=UPI000D10D3E3|nr:DUF6624 domain-containing protein [Aquimarina sp. Aq78]